LKAAFYFAGYFFIVCYHLKLCLSSIEKMLKNFMNYSKRFSMITKISIIRRLLRDHNLCKQIDQYNQYWKKYLTLTYLIFVWVACFLWYQVRDKNLINSFKALALLAQAFWTTLTNELSLFKSKAILHKILNFIFVDLCNFVLMTVAK
jgi:hypothetical protein